MAKDFKDLIKGTRTKRETLRLDEEIVDMVEEMANHYEVPKASVYKYCLRESVTVKDMYELMLDDKKEKEQK